MADTITKPVWEAYTGNITKQPYKAYIYIDGKFVKFKPMICVGTTTLASNIADIAITDKSIAG